MITFDFSVFVNVLFFLSYLGSDQLGMNLLHILNVVVPEQLSLNSIRENRQDTTHFQSLGILEGNCSFNNFSQLLNGSNW